jgi:putative two-component system hydrogenase maturation factor HypX/HoxX
MKILFITSSFNGMSQHAWLELDRLDHQVKVHIAIDGQHMIKAVDDYGPDLIIAPFLKKKIPDIIWQNNVCLIIHPGIKGDRGASSLDWAILRQKDRWGATILQADEKMDAGPIWASHTFAMRPASKACLYRHEVTQAAIKGMLEAVENFQDASFEPEPLDYTNPDVYGHWNRSTRQSDFAFSWDDPAEEIILKVRAGDSNPGVLAPIDGREYYCYGAHLEDTLKGQPGEIIARRNKAICIGTGDKAIWITHLKRIGKEAIKLPALTAMGEEYTAIPVSALGPFEKHEGATFREITFEREGDIGYLHFDFYNGAMSTDQCRRLLSAFKQAKEQPVKLIVLMGGHDVWSNGIHLNVIEHAANPADESWANINAIDDLIEEIIRSTDHYIIAAMQGNAGAGGVPFALAADKVLAREGVVLNPHTRKMGLYGSEYWTYLLPGRIGAEKTNDFTEHCLPWGTAMAMEIGLIDGTFETTAPAFRERVRESARKTAGLSWFNKLVASKRFQRRKDEAFKPLEEYRKKELAEMHKNFYENNWDYNLKRYCFVHKIHDQSEVEPVQGKDLYSSRRKIYRRRKWEAVHYEG